MKLISHRRNINGPNELTENTEECILYTINLGFDCEIDLWLVNQQIFWDMMDQIIRQRLIVSFNIRIIYGVIVKC